MRIGADEDSFGDGLLDWPHYTRPEVWEGRPVPPVLLGGNHAAIRRWRLKQALGPHVAAAAGSAGARADERGAGAARGICKADRCDAAGRDA